MKSLTLEEIRTRTDSRLTALHSRLADAEAAYEETDEHQVRRRLLDRIRRTRGSIEHTIARREECEQRSHDAVEGQIDDYNQRHCSSSDPAPWDTRFQLLTDLPEDARAAAWRRLPLCFNKRMQECLTRPEEYVVPRQNHGTVAALGPEGPALSGAEGILIDPDCLTDEFLEKLGLVTYEDHERPLGRWEKRCESATMAALHRLLAQTYPLAEGNYRLFVLPDGRLLYTSQNVQGKAGGNGPDRKAQIFEAYGAERKTHHEQALYEREIEMLEAIRLKLEPLTKVLDEWRKDTPPARKLQIETQACPVIEECAETLSAVVNVYKRAAGDTLEEIGDLTIERSRDGRRIKNPSAAMTKLLKVRSCLAKRFPEMVCKGGYNAQDNLVLRRRITRSEQAIAAVGDHLLITPAAELLPPSREPTMQELGKLRLRPFRTYAEKLLAIGSKLKDEDGSVNRTDVRVRMYLVTKLAAVGRCLEAIRVRMLGCEHLPIQTIREHVEILYRNFTDFQVTPDHIVHSYVPAFQEIAGKLAGILRGLQHYEAHPPADGDGHRALVTRFREYIDTIDIEAIVEGLPST